LFASFLLHFKEVQDAATLIGIRCLRGNDLHALNVVQWSFWQAGQQTLRGYGFSCSTQAGVAFLSVRTTTPVSGQAKTKRFIAW
jgi:hypothetical protein